MTRPVVNVSARGGHPSGGWDDPRRGVTTAFARHLRSGVRSSADALAYLRRHDVPLEHARLLLRDATRRGALDDRACARLWAEHWARQGYANAAIRARLDAKALPSSAIDDAIARLSQGEDDELSRARRLVSARRRRGRPPARLAQALAARGFEPELIERLLDATAIS